MLDVSGRTRALALIVDIVGFSKEMTGTCALSSRLSTQRPSDARIGEAKHQMRFRSMGIKAQPGEGMILCEVLPRLGEIERHGRAR